MARTKRKHDTPDWLDKFFERRVIKLEQYADFWDGFWRRRNEDTARKYVEEWKKENIEAGVVIPSTPKKRRKTYTTKFKKEAERQAKKLGGYVVRRNAKGQFSRRGRTYQVIVRRKK